MEGGERPMSDVLSEAPNGKSCEPPAVAGRTGVVRPPERTTPCCAMTARGASRRRGASLSGVCRIAGGLCCFGDCGAEPKPPLKESASESWLLSRERRAPAKPKSANDSLLPSRSRRSRLRASSSFQVSIVAEPAGIGSDPVWPPGGTRCGSEPEPSSARVGSCPLSIVCNLPGIPTGWERASCASCSCSSIASIQRSASAWSVAMKNILVGDRFITSKQLCRFSFAESWPPRMAVSGRLPEKTLSPGLMYQVSAERSSTTQRRLTFHAMCLPDLSSHPEQISTSMLGSERAGCSERTCVRSTAPPEPSGSRRSRFGAIMGERQAGGDASRWVPQERLVTWSSPSGKKGHGQDSERRRPAPLVQWIEHLLAK